MSDPAKLEKAITEFTAENEREAAPLRARLQITEGLLANHQAQLGRAEDLYILGSVNKEDLLEKKTRLGETSKRLTKERDDYAARLKYRLQSSAELQLALDFAKSQKENVEKATRDFAVRRGLIEDLQTSATLVEEAVEKVIYARCVVGIKRLLLGVSLNSC